MTTRVRGRSGACTARRPAQAERTRRESSPRAKRWRVCMVAIQRSAGGKDLLPSSRTLGLPAPLTQPVDSPRRYRQAMSFENLQALRGRATRLFRRDETAFPAGVMSGDASTTSAVVWTRYQGRQPLALTVT